MTAYQERARAYEKIQEEEKAAADRQTVARLDAEAKRQAGGGVTPAVARGRLAAMLRDLRMPGSALEAPVLQVNPSGSPADLLVDTARRTATAERRAAVTAREAADACGASDVVPDSYRAAEELFQRANALEAKGDFETAAWAFKRTQERFAEVLQEVERSLAANPALWLSRRGTEPTPRPTLPPQRLCG